jgi:polyisoprenoid-binding protein YceI
VLASAARSVAASFGAAASTVPFDEGHPVISSVSTSIMTFFTTHLLTGTPEWTLTIRRTERT